MLVDFLGLDEDDLESRPMGSPGEDIIMGKQSTNSHIQSNVRIKKNSIYGLPTTKQQKTVKDMSL